MGCRVSHRWSCARASSWARIRRAQGVDVGTAIGTIASPVLEAWISHCIAEFSRSLAESSRPVPPTRLRPGRTRSCSAYLRTRPFNHSLGRSWTLPRELPPRRKLRALGAILGEAATSRPRRVGEDLLIIAALRDLEAAISESSRVSRVKQTPTTRTSAGPDRRSKAQFPT